MSLADMSEVKFLLPLVGGQTSNKYRKLSRYTSSLGVVAAHGNVGKPMLPRGDCQVLEVMGDDRKKAVLPGSQGLLY